MRQPALAQHRGARTPSRGGFCRSERVGVILRDLAQVVQQLGQVDDVRPVLQIPQHREVPGSVRHLVGPCEFEVRAGITNFPERATDARLVEAFVAEDGGRGLARLEEEAAVRAAEPADAEPGSVTARQLHHSAPIHPEACPGHPLEVGTVERCVPQRHLDAAVAQLAAVQELAGEACRGRQRVRQQQVGHRLLVQRELERTAAAPQDRVYASFDLRLALGLDVRAARDAWYGEAGESADSLRGVELGETLAVARTIASLTEREPQFRLLDPAERIQEAVGCRGLRVP